MPPHLVSGAPGADPPRPLAAGEVHLSFATTTLLDDHRLADAYRALLTPDEVRRSSAFQVEGARRQYLLTRALVRCALSRHAAVPPAAWRFVANAQGRPEIDPPRADLHFNATNSAELVVCAVTGAAAVGVDVEPRGSAQAIDEVASRVFSSPELEALAALPAEARAERLLSLWTLKEAYAKARGLGLSLPPRAVTLALVDATATLVRAPGEREVDRWHFALLDLLGHRVALAVDAAPSVLHLWRAVPLVSFQPHPPGP